MDDIRSEAAALFLQLNGLLLRQRMRHMRRGGPFADASRGQGRVLSILKMKPEMSQRELTFLLDMSKQSLAELLAKLEKNGYITREPAPDDRRAVIIKLTEKGAAAAENLDEETPTGLLRLFECLDDGELERLCDYFRRMLAQFGDEFAGECWEQRRQWFEDLARHWHEHNGGHAYHTLEHFPGRRDWPGCFPGETQDDEEGGQ